MIYSGIKKIHGIVGTYKLKGLVCAAGSRNIMVGRIECFEVGVESGGIEGIFEVDGDVGYRANQLKLCNRI